MQISITRLRLLRDEYATDALKRWSLENDVEFIKISALMANNAGFTVYNSFPTIYEETQLQNMVANLRTLFIDSLVTTNSSENGKTFFTIDWSLAQPVTDNCTEQALVEIDEHPAIIVEELDNYKN